MRDSQFLPPVHPDTNGAQTPDHQVLPQPVVNSSGQDNQSKQPRNKSSRKLIVSIFATIVVFVALLVVSGMWYVQALEPVSSEATDNDGVRIVIQRGDSVGVIAGKLKSANLIRSTLAFRIHGEISGQATQLQTGGFIILPSESTPEIMRHMSSNVSDEFDVTIVPGLTLREISDQLVARGFSESAIRVALEKSYDHPLMAEIPAGRSLEGFIFPDTYRLAADGTPEDVITMAFDEFWRLIEENNYIERAEDKGFTLYEAITIASIIELEVTSEADQKQVAQVFLKRLNEDMPLGSDPTFIYAAELDGAAPRIDYDSPYNTRLYGGIPPGPIANFNIAALEAVVSPARGNFLYFVAGDDGTTHYSRSLAEHEANIDRYCTTLCE